MENSTIKVRISFCEITGKAIAYWSDRSGTIRQAALKSFK